ncbi:MAG: discoidin domain-containing protein [Trichodesmium sp. MAG_R04]|jgi:hypothetical protein|nr:discoidin domain-containing protein [Trichodesmium sp. MAG_R04]
MAIIKYQQKSSDVNNILKSYSKDITSQNGEDGILEKIFEVIGEQNYSKWCVEFGAWDGKHLSNTYNLIVNKGWSSVLIEADPKKFKQLMSNLGDRENLYCFEAWVGFESNDNLESILSKTPIPKEFGLASIDVDGCDYYIWESIQNYKPLVVIIEYNPTVPNDIIFVQDKDMSLSQGASLLALIELGKQKGYELVAVTNTNGIFVLAEKYIEFGIKDNDIDKMRCDYGKRIWQGYDGTIFTNNFSYLAWRKVHIDPEDLQVLSKAQRAKRGRSTKALDSRENLPKPPGENIALNKPAQQSSYSKWSQPNESSRAVNGVKNGSYSFSTNIEVNPWWQVDLEDIYVITQVRVYNRVDNSSAERARTLKILFSTEGNDWQEVYSNDDQLVPGGVGGIYGKPLIVSTESKIARYVRIQLNKKTYLHLDEVEVYGSLESTTLL